MENEPIETTDTGEDIQQDGNVFAAALNGATGEENAGQDTETAAAPETADAGFQLPEEFANDPAFSNFHDLAGLCKSYRETKALVGKKQSGITENSTPEEVAAFYRTLGAGEKPEDYKELKFSDKAPEFLRDDAVMNKYYAAFAKNNVPRSIAAGLLADVEADVVAEIARQRAARLEAQNQEVAKLRTDWGGEMEANLNKAQSVWKRLRPDWDINTHPLGDNVEVIRLFADLYPLLGDGTVMAAGGNPETALATVEAKIKEIMDNPVYWTPGPEQETLKSQMAALMSQKVKLQGKAGKM